MSLTFNEIVAQINAAGFNVNNCFQLADDKWQANLYDRSGKKGYEFAHAADPVEALRLAFEKIDPKNAPEAPPIDDDGSDLV